MSFDGGGRLLTPSIRQPQGIPYLDPNNFWAPDTLFILPVGNGAIDLVSRTFLTLSGSPIPLVNVAGRALNSTNTSRLYMPITNPAPINSGGTFISQFASSTTYGSPFRFFQNSTYSIFAGEIGHAISGNATFQIGYSTSNSSWTSPSASTPNGTLHTVAVSWNGNNNSTAVTMLIDGAPVTPAFSYGVGSIQGLNYFTLLSYPAGTYPLNGAVNYVYVDSKVRSPEELATLTFNPYVSLRSSVQFLGTRTAAPTFIPAWALNSSTCIGGGAYV